MEKVVVGFEINANGDQVSNSVKSIKTELRQATQDAIALSRKFGDTSVEAVEAQKKVANLKEEVSDFKQRVDALNPEAKFRAFGQVLQGVAGGFAGLQGAIGLFGTENKELEKQLLKVQSALALSEGINSVLGLTDAFKTLSVVIRTNVVAAFTTLRGAIIATGLGALAVAIGYVVANFDSLKEKLGLGEDAYTKLEKQTNAQNAALERQIKLLEIQGGKEDEVAELQKQKIQNSINLLNAKETLTADETKMLLDLENEKVLIDARELKRKQDLEDAKLKAFQDKQKELQNLSKQIGKENELETKLGKDKEIEALKQKYQEQKDLFKQYGVDTTELSTQYYLQLDAINKKYAEIEIQTEKEKKLAKIAIQKEYVDVVSQFGDLLQGIAGQNKSLAIAGVIISQGAAIGEILTRTASGIATATAVAAPLLANPFSAPLAAKNLARTIALTKISAGIGIAGAIAGAAKGIAQINKANVPGGDSGGNAGGGGGAGGIQAPIAQGVAVQQTNNVGTSNVNIKNTDAIKAYVVERDITDSQDRINKIKAAATFGG